MTLNPDLWKSDHFDEREAIESPEQQLWIPGDILSLEKVSYR